VAYTIIVEWPPPAAGSEPSAVPLPWDCQVDYLNEALQEIGEDIFKGEFFEDDGHWGKAGRLTFARCEAEPTEETTARLRALFYNSHPILITTID
jgi:hypothetical protein